MCIPIKNIARHTINAIDSVICVFQSKLVPREGVEPSVPGLEDLVPESAGREIILFSFYGAILARVDIFDD